MSNTTNLDQEKPDMTTLDKKHFVGALQYNHKMASKRMAVEGRALYDMGFVKINCYTDTTLECDVQGPLTSVYHVMAKLVESQLLVSCDCTEGEKDSLCMHFVAASLVAQKVFKEEIKNSWEKRLLFVYEGSRQRKPAPKEPGKYVLLFVLYGNCNCGNIRPVCAPLEKLLAAGLQLPQNWNNEDLVKLLKLNPKACEEFNSDIKYPLKPETCLNASTQLVHLAQMLHHLASENEGLGLVLATPGVLETLRDENFPLYLGLEHYNTLRLYNSHPLKIMSDMANILLNIENQDNGDLCLQFHLNLGIMPWKATKKPAVVTQIPQWLLVDDLLIPASENLNVEQIANLSQASYTIIPAAEKGQFLKSCAPHLVQQYIITGSGVNIKDFTEKTRPRLYLQDNRGELEVCLKFGYGAFEVPFESRIPLESSVLYDLDTDTFNHIFRDVQVEKNALVSLHGYGLKGATGNPGRFKLRARVDLGDFLDRYIPQAIEDGFEIYGLENIKNVRINYHTPAILLNSSSDMDWI